MLNRRKTGGWTIIELVAVLFLTGIITMAFIQFLTSVSQAITRPTISYNGQSYALAPVFRDSNDGVTKSDALDAIALHQEFSRQLQLADFVAVFGGSNLDLNAPAAKQALLTSFNLTSLPSLNGVSPSSLMTVPKLAAAANADLSSQYDVAADGYAYTVLIFQGTYNIVAIAQVRRYTGMNYNGAAAVCYQTTLQSRVPPSTTWVNYGYNFFLPAAEDNWAVQVGAVHYWLRNETSWWGRSEEAGAAVVLPDPFVLATQSADAKVKPVSRFSYFLYASPF